MSRALKILGALVVVLLAALTFRTLTSVRSSAPSPQAMASDEPAPSPSGSVDAGVTEALMYRDFAIDADALPTEREDQSKLWYANDSWWGVLLAPGTGEYRIHRLDWASQEWIDTGILVDERTDAHADALAAGDTVWIVSAGERDSSRHGARLMRYTLDPTANRYTLDPDFPVQLTDGGARGITVARDSLDRLWIAYVTDAAVVLNHSDGDDHVWGAPFALPLRGSAVGSDQAVLVAHDTSLTIVWSNQREDALYAGTRLDSDPVDAWTSLGIALRGVDEVDDHVDVKVLPTDDGPRLFIATKTSLDQATNPNPEWEQILLLGRGPDGEWRRYLYGTLRDRHTRPILQLDPARGEVYVIAASPTSGGAIYYKRSSLDRISFPSGKGTPLVAGSADTHVNSPTSTKQMIDAGRGVVVLAFDAETKRYLHGVLPLGAAAPQASPDALASPQPNTTPPPVVAAIGALVTDTFDPWPAGSALPNGWTDDGLPTGALFAGAAGGQVATIVSGADGGRGRACKELPAVAAEQVTVQLEVSVSGFGGSDAELLSLSGDGTQALSLRVNSRGRMAYLTGGDKAVLTQVIDPGAWYTLSATVDAEAGVYAWTLTDVNGAVLVALDGQLLLAPVTALDRICLRTSSEVAGVQLAFDNITVTRNQRP